MNNYLFSGITVPLLTPFNKDGSINKPEYEKLIEYVISGGVSGLFVGGTSGEFVNLSLGERIKQLKIAKNTSKGRARILFNITALDIEDLMQLIDAAKEYSADAVSITPPFYYKYDDKALANYFCKVASLCYPIPVYLYNIPGMAKNIISPNVFKEVCMSSDNIRGIKDSSMDFMTFLEFQIYSPSDNIEILTGNDAQVLTALQAGGFGAVIAMANVYPKLCVSIVENYRLGNIEKARACQEKVLLLRSLVREVMPIMSHKYMLTLLNFEMGPARFPFRDLTPEEQKKIADGVARINP